MNLLLRSLVLSLTVLLLATGASGHALQPGFLGLSAQGDGVWRVTWRVPDVNGAPMALDVLLPGTCDTRSAPALRFDGIAHVATWRVSCPGGIAGGAIAVGGLEATQTDVLVRADLAPGQAATLRLTPRLTSAVLPVVPSRADIAGGYAAMGVEHILSGTDHLLFVFALLLLVPDLRRLVGAITAFTVAHSLSLVAATLGWVNMPGPPVEAVIALSIMFLAAELARPHPASASLLVRRPWPASFGFGILHGLGFAGALAEIGLPAGDIPLALLAFNVGVEIGQLAFVLAVLLTALALGRLYPALVRSIATPGRGSRRWLAYAIGTVSASWLLSRLAAF